MWVSCSAVEEVTHSFSGGGLLERQRKGSDVQIDVSLSFCQTWKWWLKERVHAHPRPPPNVVWAIASQKHPRCMLGAFKPIHLWRNRSEGMLIPALNRALVITMGTDSMLLTTSFKCDKILKYSTESKRDRYFWQWSWNWPSAPEQLNKESSASSFDQSVLKQCKFSLS